MSTTKDTPLRNLWYRVATLQGYTIEVYPSGNQWGFKLCLDGDLQMAAEDDMDTEDRAHLAVMHHLPEYIHSVDAALSLIPNDANLNLDSMRNPREWLAAITGLDYKTGNGKADTPALAICHAFLAWRESAAVATLIELLEPFAHMDDESEGK